MLDCKRHPAVRDVAIIGPCGPEKRPIARRIVGCLQRWNPMKSSNRYAVSVVAKVSGNFEFRDENWIVHAYTAEDAITQVELQLKRKDGGWVTSVAPAPDTTDMTNAEVQP